MPLYEYECPKCRRRVELIQGISESGSLPLSPVCSEEECGLEMERIIGQTTFVLKGGGWAKDGYSSVKK